jgi:hypothetical protein
LIMNFMYQLLEFSYFDAEWCLLKITRAIQAQNIFP